MTTPTFPLVHFPPLVEARLLRRDNRFRATALLADGREVAVHVPNSGRLGEIFDRPRRAWLAKASNPNRKTPYDLAVVEYNGGVLISVDARLPNRLFAAALRAGVFDEWLGLSGEEWHIRPEPPYGEGRLDFLLEASNRRWWVETKSVTLVEDGVALFPDAPTERGRRHLADLCRLVRSGERAAVVFIAQREDVVAFAPNGHNDPAFPPALRDAAACGVLVKAYRARVTLKGLGDLEEIPLRLLPA